MQANTKEWLITSYLLRLYKIILVPVPVRFLLMDRNSSLISCSVLNGVCFKIASKLFLDSWDFILSTEMSVKELTEIRIWTTSSSFTTVLMLFSVHKTMNSSPPKKKTQKKPQTKNLAGFYTLEAYFKQPLIQGNIWQCSFEINN